MADFDELGFEIIVHTWMDYQRLVAEFAHKDGPCFIINEEAGIGCFEIELHPRPDRLPWKLRLTEFTRALDACVERLRALGPEIPLPGLTDDPTNANPDTRQDSDPPPDDIIWGHK